MTLKSLKFILCVGFWAMLPLIVIVVNGPKDGFAS